MQPPQGCGGGYGVGGGGRGGGRLLKKASPGPPAKTFEKTDRLCRREASLDAVLPKFLRMAGEEPSHGNPQSSLRSPRGTPTTPRMAGEEPSRGKHCPKTAAAHFGESLAKILFHRTFLVRRAGRTMRLANGKSVEAAGAASQASYMAHASRRSSFPPSTHPSPWLPKFHCSHGKV